MRNDILTVMVLCCISITLICILAAIFVYEKTEKRKTLINSSDWLFSGFQEEVYKFFYKKEPIDRLCGIDVKKYERYCRIIHKKSDIKNIISLRIEGFFAMLLFLSIGLLNTENTLIFVICLSGASAFAYGLGIYPEKRIQSFAEERMFLIKDDLPRFISLLEKAMDLPIDQAILITAGRFKSPLSEDLLDCIHQVSLGAEGWQTTLVELAHIYDMESFSDLILEIIHSYEQGNNIRHLINRKAYELEQIRLYDVEAHDSKIKSMIFLPVIALKVMPLMVLICLPMLTNF